MQTMMTKNRDGVFLAVLFLGCLANSDHANNSPVPDVTVEILADTDRDGWVDSNDSTGKDTWTKSRGAIYTVNYDADGGLSYSNGSSPANRRSDAIGFGDDGLADFEDYDINSPATVGGPADVDDIAPIKIKAMPGLPPDYRVFLKIDSPASLKAVHIFPKRTVQLGTPPRPNRAIWGGGHNPTFPAPWTDADATVTDIEVTKWLNPNATAIYEETRAITSDPYYEFGVEGLLLAGMDCVTSVGTQSFSGEIHLTVEVRDSTGTVAISGLADSICMHVAPWLGLTPSEDSDQIWAALATDDTNFTADSAPFRDAPLNVAHQTTGFLHSPHSVQARLVSTASHAGSQFFKDHLEFGYTQRPHGPKMHLVFRLPYFRINFQTPGTSSPQPVWPVANLLLPEVGVFQIGTPVGTGNFATSGNYGGNLAFLPRSATKPNGTLIMGRTVSSSKLRSFFEAQSEQIAATPGNSFGVNTSWLSSGHLDDISAFLSGNRVVIADTRLAITTLQAGITAGDARIGSVFFTAGTDTRVGAVTTATGPANPNRIHTGINHPAEGKPYEYIRFVSGAADGLVAKITLGNGFVDVATEAPIGPPGASAGLALWDSYSGPLITPKMRRYRDNIKSGVIPLLSGWPPGRAPAPGDKFVLVVNSLRLRPKVYGAGSLLTTFEGMPALISVQELLSDTEFFNFNHDQCKITLDQCRTQVQAAAGTGVSLQFVPVPVLFFGIGTSSGASDASGSYDGAVSLCPVACNLQELGANGPPANSGIYLPRQFAPVIDNGNTGRDIFENAILASNIGGQICFVDDWKGYHRYSGDVHCGTNVKRIVPPNNWWQ